MKNIFSKTLLVSALFSGAVGVASADTLLNQSLGATAGATDVFRMVCSDDGGGAPVQVYARVKDKTAGTNALTATIIKGNTAGAMAAKSSTDVTGADATYSPGIRLAAGAPTTTYYYFVVVTKDTAAARSYDLEAHCEAAGNIHTGTSIATAQNQ